MVAHCRPRAIAVRLLGPSAPASASMGIDAISGSRSIAPVTGESKPPSWQVPEGLRHSLSLTPVEA